jgi:hypothetical protein
MTRNRKLLVGVLAVTVLLAGCAGALVDNGGDSPGGESDTQPADDTAAEAADTASDDTQTTTEPSTPAELDAAAIAEAMQSADTVSFELDQSTTLFGESQNVSLDGAADTDNGEARLETTVELPRDTQEWTTYVVNDTIYTKLFDTWTKADLSGVADLGAWRERLAGQRFDAVELTVLDTRTFEGNKVYVVDVERNLSALTDGSVGFDAGRAGDTGYGVDNIVGNVSFDGELFENVTDGERGGLFGNLTEGEFVETGTTMYVDTETSRVRYIETTVSVGDLVSTRTTTTLAYGDPVEVDLPADARNARDIFAPFR